MRDGIVIAGGGLAAQRAAETLRRLDYCGPMRMIAAEAHLPYDRPPLSKELLSGERDHGEIAFRLADWYAQHDVDLMLGVAATSLCPGEHKLGLSDGSVLRCDRLLIATGSRPRRLPLLEPYENVHELRTVDDARALRKALRPGTRLVVIGAGFIGMEVAATARRLGAEVTLVEAASNPLAQILGDRLGGWFADLHRAEGVRVLTHRQVTDALGKRTARWLRLSDDTVIEADLVLVAIGVQPDAAWLAGTPSTRSGIPVDAHGRTGVRDVYAAGDVAATYDPVSRRHVPGSHWEAAARQAARAARAMLGLDPGDVEAASFWSDQYELRIHYLGHAALADTVTIDGEPSQRNFTAHYTRAGQLVGALLVDRPRSLPTIRKQLSPPTNTT